MDSRHTNTTTNPPQDIVNPAAASACLPSDIDTSSKKTPDRSCIVTRETHHKDALWRFVCDKENTLHFDLNHKLPGRGMYMLPDAVHLQTALSKNLFSRAAKTQVSIPADMMTHIYNIIYRAALNNISLARRSGSLIISSEKIKTFMRTLTIGCYITSSDSGSDTRQSITSKLNDTPTITRFTADELAKTLNLENPVHLAIKPGALCNKFLIYNQQLTDLTTLKDK